MVGRHKELKIINKKKKKIMNGILTRVQSHIFQYNNPAILPLDHAILRQ